VRLVSMGLMLRGGSFIGEVGRWGVVWCGVREGV